MLLPLIQIIPFFIPVIRTATGDFPSGASKRVCNKKIWCLNEYQELNKFVARWYLTEKFKDWWLGKMISQHYLVPSNRRSVLIDFGPCYLPPPFLCEHFSCLSRQGNLQIRITRFTLGFCYHWSVILWWMQSSSIPDVPNHWMTDQVFQCSNLGLRHREVQRTYAPCRLRYPSLTKKSLHKFHVQNSFPNSEDLLVMTYDSYLLGVQLESPRV